MEKIIEIDLLNKYDLIEKYDAKKISNRMIEYIIRQNFVVNRKEKIKIIVNKKCHLEQNVTQMIREGLKEEYDKSLKRHKYRNFIQICFFILGVVLIFLSTLIKADSIWREVVLISGWVPIWKMVEIEILHDMEGRRRRKVLKKLLKSKIIEKTYEI